MSRIHRILDLARWAPSGDNSQPWRFEIRSDSQVVVHPLTRQLGVYDLDGRAAWIAVGGLLETMRIAASIEGCVLDTERRGGFADSSATIDVRLRPSTLAAPDPLQAYIRTRSVQRKSLSTRSLDAGCKLALEESVGSSFQVRWFEGARQRFRLAWLAFRSAKVRLTIPEAYQVHRRIIEWDARFSDDRIPDQALGTDPLSVRSMRWVLASWPRVQFMNRYLGGTLLPRLQLELVPGLRCAAHFALIAQQEPRDVDDYLAAGAAAQRFWLTATRLGLQLQPQHTPLMFAAYAREGVRFTENASAIVRAAAIARMLDRALDGPPARRAAFLGRLGRGSPADARSLRLSLDRLMWSADPP